MLRAYFYTGNYICLYRATCGAIPSFEKSQNVKYSEIRDFVQGAVSPCGTGAYPRSLWLNTSDTNIWGERKCEIESYKRRVYEYDV